jgi:hypothetical protein
MECVLDCDAELLGPGTPLRNSSGRRNLARKSVNGFKVHSLRVVDHPRTIASSSVYQSPTTILISGAVVWPVARADVLRSFRRTISFRRRIASSLELLSLAKISGSHSIPSPPESPRERLMLSRNSGRKPDLEISKSRIRLIVGAIGPKGVWSRSRGNPQSR